SKEPPMFCWRMLLASSAVIATDTSWIFSSRRCAVTTTSSRRLVAPAVEPASCACAGSDKAPAVPPAVIAPNSSARGFLRRMCVLMANLYFIKSYGVVCRAACGRAVAGHAMCFTLDELPEQFDHFEQMA